MVRKECTVCGGWVSFNLPNGTPLKAEIMCEACLERGGHRFLSNTYNPDSSDAKMRMVYSLHAVCSGETACAEEWKYHIEWINENICGRPHASNKHTVEQLEGMGLIGIYSKDGKGE